jgi:3-phenylpropionate/cinnamic acid dioxygenase small subunit
MNPREGIERLLYAYSDTLDRGDFEATAALFGDAGLYGLVGSGAARGAHQVLATMRGSVRTYDGVPRTRHVVTNVVIDVDSDQTSGNARSYVTVMHQAPQHPLAPVVAGTYFDRVHIVDGAWQFAERRMHIELVGDTSTHLNTSPF